MTTEIKNFFQNENTIEKILNKPAIQKRINNGTSRFNMEIDKNIVSEINSKLNINLNYKRVPIHITNKDISEHKDINLNTKQADQTYMIYLTDTATKLKIDGVEYEIEKNKAFKFNENTIHGTINGNKDTRVMLGPFNNNGDMMGTDNPGICSIFSFLCPNLSEGENSNISIPKGKLYFVNQSLLSQ